MKRRFLFLLAAVVLLAGMFVTSAYGAEADVLLDCPEQVAPGSSFSAALLYEGDTFTAANVEVTYDPEILEFRSCNGGEGFAEDGSAKITLNGADGKVYLSCKLRFKALKEGESFLTVSTVSLQNVNEEELIAQTRSVKVLVTAEAEESAADSAEDEGETGEERGDGSDDEGDGEEIYILTVLKTAADRVFTGFTELVTQFSVTEFLLFSLCITVILLLLVLLAVDKRR